MARWWVPSGGDNGTGTWDASSTTHWAASSGGVGGASVPTNSDSVVFDGNSGTGTVTVSGTRVGLALLCVGNGSNILGDYGGTISGGTIVIGNGANAGNVALSSTMTITSTLQSTGSANKQITTNGTSIGGLIQGSIGVATGAWQLQDDLTVTGQISFITGIISPGGHNITCDNITDINRSGAGPRQLGMSSGTLRITGTGTIVNLTDTSAGSSYNFNGATVELSSSSASSRTVTFNSSAATNLGNVHVIAGSGTLTITATAIVNDLDFTGFSGTWANAAITIKGGLTLASGMTVTGGAGTATFTATAGPKTLTANGVAFDRPITFNGSGGSWQLADDWTIGSTRTVTLTNGTFDLNGRALSCGLFSTSNSNTRALNGNGSTLSLTGTGTVWDSSTSTGLTVNPTIKLTNSSSSSKTFSGGGGTFPVLYNATGSTGVLIISGSSTFTTLQSDPGRTWQFTAGTTQTFTNWAMNGIAGSLVTIQSTTGGSTATLSKSSGEVLGDYLSLQDSAATGGATFYAGTHSTNVSGNSGWIFTTAAPHIGSFFLIMW